MAEKKTKKKKWYQKLRNKYRLVIMNDENFEERLSFRLSRLNVFIVLGTITIILIVGTIYIIAFTPLREYIPGYTDVSIQKKVYDNMLRADSLEIAVKQRDRYISDIKRVIDGEFVEPELKSDSSNPGKYDTIKLRRSAADSMLRAEIENQSQYNLAYGYGEGEEIRTVSSALSSFFFFTPVKGIVSNPFNMGEKHYGIDIIAKKNEAIKSTLDGMVIFSDWTLETGYVMAIQHQHNILSIYKHNSALLKKVGNYVKAGEVIAIIGETGELSSGPHLHFELWYHGNPVNPKDYMTF
jgi:murein DD-endopeptidase MepM/ murein hydrolase activator NlpD